MKSKIAIWCLSGVVVGMIAFFFPHTEKEIQIQVQKEYVVDHDCPTTPKPNTDPEDIQQYEINYCTTENGVTCNQNGQCAKENDPYLYTICSVSCERISIRGNPINCSGVYTPPY